MPAKAKIDIELLKKLWTEGASWYDIQETLNYSRSAILNQLTKQNWYIPRNPEYFSNRNGWIIGKKFGMIEVLKETDKKQHGAVLFECKCDCGNTCYSYAKNISWGDFRSCGCIRDKGYKEIPGYYWQVLLKNAESRNISISTTLEYIRDLYVKQDFRCAMTGMPLTFGKNWKGKYNDKTASLDRIDSNKGYEDGNLQWIHKNINLMKNVLSNDLFIDWCKKIANYHDSHVYNYEDNGI